MAEYSKTSGVALKITEYSESSQIITLWTRDFGKLQAIAKGARRQKHGGGAGIGLLDLCELVFVKKPPPALNIIASWQVLDGLPGLRTGLSRLYAAMYAAEFVSRATEEGDPEPQIFRLLVSFLRALAAGASCYPALLRFELLLLLNVGLAPHTTSCATCGAEPGQAPRFSPEAGGVVCGNCARAHPAAAGLAVSRDVLNAMALLSAKRTASSQLNLSNIMIRQIRLLLDGHITYHLGRPLEMRKYVNPQDSRGEQRRTTEKPSLLARRWEARRSGPPYAGCDGRTSAGMER